MFRRISSDVIIAGAGPIGLFTALLLRRAGLSVTLAEKTTQTNIHAYAALLHPETCRLFEEHGLLEDLMPAARQVSNIALYRKGGKAAEIDLHDLPGLEKGYVLAMAQSELEEVLEHRLLEAGGRVLWNSVVTDILLKEDGTEALLERHGDVPSGYPVLDMQNQVVSTSRMRAPWMVGADGVHSSVRRALHIPIHIHGDVERWIFFEAECDAPVPAEICLFRNEDGCRGGLWPMAGNTCRWSFSVPSRPAAQEPLDLLHDFIERCAPWFEGNVQRIIWWGSGVFETRAAEAWGSGRALLAGDSAHSGTPISVISMNSGLQEAHDLAGRLIRVVQGDDQPQALDQYAAQWRDRWKAVINAPEETEVLEDSPELQPFIRMLPLLRANRVAAARLLKESTRPRAGA